MKIGAMNVMQQEVITIRDVRMREIPFADIFDIAAKSDKVAGVVINPFGRYFKADKSVIECIYEVFENMED